MKLSYLILLGTLYSPLSLLFGQSFVYPVGNPAEQPSQTFPNANGYKIVQGFDNSDGHTGVDLADGAEGGEIRSIGPGIVSFRASTVNSFGFGNVVIIRHDLVDGTFYSLYAHMQEGSVLLSEGDTVNAGTPIGKVDCSGSTYGDAPCPSNGGKGPHLHFAVKKLSTLGCGYINSKCTSGDSFANYVDPLVFVANHLGPKTIVLQPGSDTGMDIWTTSVYSYASCSSPGPGGGLYDYELRLGGWGDWYYILMEFDLTGLPTKATSATLQLYCYDNNTGRPSPMYLDRITQFWWDWQSMGSGCDHQRLWWADKPPSVQWSATAIPAPNAGQWCSVDITDLYNAWQAGQFPNYGLQLRPAQIANNFNDFYSSRYTTDTTLRPKLVIQQ